MSWWRDLEPSSLAYLAVAQTEFLRARGRGMRERWREVLLTWWRVHQV